MAATKQSTLDDLLLEQSLDHILNSPPEEFAHYAAEHDLSIEDLKAINKQAAAAALNSVPATLNGNRGNAEAEPFVDRLVAAAKRLNFALTKQDFKDWSEDSLRTQMAYSRSHKDKRTNIRKRK